jgi:hypothetical protein
VYPSPSTGARGQGESSPSRHLTQAVRRERTSGSDQNTGINSITLLNHIDL